MYKQITLGKSEEEIKNIIIKTKEEIKEELHNQKYEKCYFCKKEELIEDKKLNWYNGGNLFPYNFTAHQECYLKALKEKGYMENGFEKIGYKKYKFFSETTGIEYISLNNEIQIKIMEENIFENTLFPYSITIYKNNKHIHTFGITKEFKEELEQWENIQLEN